MASLKQSLQTAAVRESLRYIGRNPGNVKRLVSILRLFAKVPEHRDIIDRAEAVWRSGEQLAPIDRAGICSAITGVIEVQRTLLMPLSRSARGHELGEQLQCNIPGPS